MEGNVISDSQIIASSEYYRGYGARNARLNFQPTSDRAGAWSSEHLTIEEWLQVDFQKSVTVGKVATQGRPDWPQWVETYSLSYSMNESVFTVLQQNGSDKVCLIKSI